jgi:hypothetical protein
MFSKLVANDDFIEAFKDIVIFLFVLIVFFETDGFKFLRLLYVV